MHCKTFTSPMYGFVNVCGFRFLASIEMNLTARSQQPRQTSFFVVSFYSFIYPLSLFATPLSPSPTPTPTLFLLYPSNFVH